MNLILIAALIASALISLIFIFVYSGIVYDKWKLRKRSGSGCLPGNTRSIPSFLHMRVVKW